MRHTHEAARPGYTDIRVRTKQFKQLYAADKSVPESGDDFRRGPEMEIFLVLGAIVVLSVPIAAVGAWWVYRMAGELTRFTGWRAGPWAAGQGLLATRRSGGGSLPALGSLNRSGI